MPYEHKIILQPSGRRTSVPDGTTILEAISQAGLTIETPCGGAGACGKCRVKLLSGTTDTPVTDEEIRLLGQDAITDGWRLACRTKVISDLIIELPDSISTYQKPKILSSHTKTDFHLDPSIALKAASNKGTAEVVVQGNNTLGTYQHGNMKILPGLAFDIGSTTIVGSLEDLLTGKSLATASSINPQTAYGDDILSRIKKCMDEKDGLKILQKTAVGAVNEIILKLCGETNIDPVQIYSAVFAGNSAMQQMFCGIDPTGLGTIPFEPAFFDPPILFASDINLCINPRAHVRVFPQIGGFVGGDTVAGLTAIKFDQSQGPALYIDVGTNGELALSYNGKLQAASVAAGPAFEGARVVNGMRATSGAIEKVILINGDFEIGVIDNVRPIGICGTGLIDAASQMLRTGILDLSGRISNPSELPHGISPKLRERIVEQDGRYDIVLAKKDLTGTGAPIFLSQKDIRELQLANAALRTGTKILLQNAGLKLEDITTVFLAGGFGNYVRLENARRIGLLPPISCKKIKFIGNASLLGAKMALLSKREEAYAAGIRKKTEHINLSSHPSFQDVFAESIFFPDAEPSPECF